MNWVVQLSLQVLLITSVGEIDIELWSKEAPKACRNFVQLCMEGYYDGTIFHRLVPDFIVQGGDPTGTGNGGESIYGKPFQVDVCCVCLVYLVQLWDLNLILDISFTQWENLDSVLR